MKKGQMGSRWLRLWLQRLRDQVVELELELELELESMGDDGGFGQWQQQQD